MWLASLCAIVLSFARVIVGQDSDNLFIVPTAPGPSDNFIADLSWTIGSFQNIQWTTAMDSYYIALFQQSVDPASGTQLQTVYTADSNGAGQQSFPWQVQTYNSNISFSPFYFLWLNPGSPQGFTSHYFNITSQAASSSSSSTSTAFTSSSSLTTSIPTSSSLSSLTTSMPTSSSSSTATQRGSNTAPASTSSTSSSTDAVKVGLGVGVGIGVPLVLIAGIWIGLKAVKQRQSSGDVGSSAPLSQYPDMMYPPGSYPPPNKSMYYANELHEAPGQTDEPHEVSGGIDLIELGSRET